MKNALAVCVSTITLLAAVGTGISPALADPGLLLIAHGSPSPEWNKPLFDFGGRVAEEIKKAGRFKTVRTAMLEAAKPDVPTAVAELEEAGCDRIIAVPLFVAPSGHTHFDVPAVLGIYWSEQTAAVLSAEGAKAARPSVPVILAPTLSESKVLPKYALDQVRKLSRSPKEEALVILAHGDPEHHLLVDRMMRQVTTYCCGEAGIGYGDWAYIGVGQEYLTNGLAAIKAASEHKKRVLVVGLYVSSSAAKIHQRRVNMARQREPGFDPLRGLNVVFSDDAIVGHPDFLRWVLEASNSVVGSMPGRQSTTARDEKRKLEARVSRAPR